MLNPSIGVVANERNTPQHKNKALVVCATSTKPMEFEFDSISKSVEAFKRGELVVVMDDEDRENEGDLLLAAEFATPEKLAFMIRQTSGILCVPLTADRAAHLELDPMVNNNTDPKKTAFTVSCDVEGTTTGVSAYDRTLTTKALADPNSTASMFRKPGHMFPLVARPGGVLERRGHTEANVDFCILAGVAPVGLLAEIQNKDGTMARLPECYALAKKHGLCITTVEALAQYRSNQMPKIITEPIINKPDTESINKPDEVELLAECEMPIGRGDKYLGMWTVRCYRSSDGLSRHAVLIKGSPSQWQNSSSSPVYTRIHSECFTSHILGSRKCDCSQQLDLSLEIINANGSGVAIYVEGHEGRGIGLHNKLKAYHLQQHELLDTYQANRELGLPIDSRSYDVPRAILKHLGISKIALLTNNPLKVQAFHDIATSVVPVICEPHEHNFAYLHSKRAFEQEHSKLISMPPSSVNASPLLKEVAIALPSLENIAKLRVGIIRTSWNNTLVNSLSSQCRQALVSSGVVSENIVSDVWDVPGAFELPFSALRLANSGSVDAIICFGVLIKGETQHFEYISSAVSSGLMQVQLSANIPVLYGVLNCLTMEQAKDRCGPNSPLPQSLAATAIRMASLNVETKKPLPDLIATRMNMTAPMMPPCSQG